MELPSLEQAGIGKRFRVFVEIARHPNGMTITDLTKAFFKVKPGSKKFQYAAQGLRHHVDLLCEAGYITTEYERRDGHVSIVCKATVFGVSTVNDEMCRLCQVMHEIQKEAKL